MVTLKRLPIPRLTLLLELSFQNLFFHVLLTWSDLPSSVIHVKHFCSWVIYSYVTFIFLSFNKIFIWCMLIRWWYLIHPYQPQKNPKTSQNTRKNKTKTAKTKYDWVLKGRLLFLNQSLMGRKILSILDLRLIRFTRFEILIIVHFFALLHSISRMLR